MVTMANCAADDAVSSVPIAQVFVINLAHRSERIDMFEQQLVEAGDDASQHEHEDDHDDDSGSRSSRRMKNILRNYTRIDAVDAKVAQQAIHSGQARVNSTFRDPYFGRQMKMGEVGCALSHIKAWKAAATSLTSPGQYAIILEDDAEFQRLDNDVDFAGRLDEIVRGAVEQQQENGLGVDFVYLTHKKDHGSRQPVNELFKTCSYTYWTIGYMISYDAAQKLAQNEEHYRMNIIPSDEYLPIVTGAFDGYNEHNCDTEVCRADLKASLDPRYSELRLTCLTAKEPLIMPRIGQVSDTELSEIVIDESSSASEALLSAGNQLLVLTVATDGGHFGYQTLARTLNFFGYTFQTLGLELEWTGGDVIRTTGGGMKLHLMREYLSQIDGEQIILFVDGYDTAAQLGPDVLLQRFAQIDADVVFGAELACWPSQELCNKYTEYLTTTSTFRFLNSGTYMGSTYLLAE